LSELYRAIEERFCFFISIINEQISGKMPVVLICFLTVTLTGYVKFLCCFLLFKTCS